MNSLSIQADFAKVALATTAEYSIENIQLFEDRENIPIKFFFPEKAQKITIKTLRLTSHLFCHHLFLWARRRSRLAGVRDNRLCRSPLFFS